MKLNLIFFKLKNIIYLRITFGIINLNKIKWKLNIFISFSLLSIEKRYFFIKIKTFFFKKNHYISKIFTYLIFNYKKNMIVN